MAKGKRERKVRSKANTKVNSKSNINTTWRLVFLGIIAILMVAIIIIVKNIISLHIEQNRLTNQEKDLQNKKEELTAELQGVDDLDYIEEQARKLLKMIKPGEVIYILNGEDPRPESAKDEEKTEIPQPQGEPPTQPEEPEETYVEEEIVYDEPVYDEEVVSEEVSEEEGTGEEEVSEGTGEETSYEEETYTEEEGSTEESYSEGESYSEEESWE